jgi:hypothetical protein
MTNLHSGIQRVTPTDGGTSADTGRLTGSARTTIAPDQQRASSKREPHPTADRPALGDARRGFSRNSMNGSVHRSTVFAKTETPIIKLLLRIERLEARAAARIDIEADIQAASAILSEPDIWKHDSMLATEAMIALWDVYGLEALVLARH